MGLPSNLSSSWHLEIYDLEPPDVPHETNDEPLTFDELRIKAAIDDVVPLQAVINGLVEQGDELGRSCKSVILETQYVDRDFADAYGALYSRCFQGYNRMCYRFHFFSEKVSPEHLNIDNRSWLQNCYQGFCVMRPSQPDTVGRTVITPPKSSCNNHFVLCRSDHQLNLVGIPLKANGSPFMQQDGMVGACATAAIWMAHTVLSKQRGLRLHSTTEITRIADLSYPSTERIFPSSGLTVMQVAAAMKKMGHETQQVDLTEADSASMTEWLYRYIESQIPVVLGVNTGNGLHAITVVGHSLIKKRDIEFKDILGNPNRNSRLDLTSMEYCSSAQWVDSFIIMDDQHGPYLKGNVISTSQAPTSIMLETGSSFPMYELIAGVVPLPEHVYLTGESAEETAATILSLLKNMGLFQLDEGEEGVVLRTLLIPSNLLKENFNDPKRVIPSKLRDFYKWMHLPRYVWLVEVSTKNRWCREDEPRTIIGEIVIDPTANKNKIDAITVNLKGIFWAKDVNNEESIIYTFSRSPAKIPDWYEYPCLSRPCS